jgi:hypothetical protein
LCSFTIITSITQAQWLTNGSNIYFNTGNVGIGTTAPAQNLEIATNGSSYVQLTNNWDVLGTVGAIKFNMAGTDLGGIEAERTVAEGRLSALKFFVRGGSGTGEAMRITQDGNVGIGTAIPTDKLVLDMGSTRGAINIISDGSSAVYSDLKFSVKTTTNLAADKPTIWLASMRKDGFFSGDVTGPTLEFYSTKKAGGYYAPLLFKSNGDIILAGANSATNGNVGIGTTDTKGYKLAVNGDAIFTRIKVKTYASWPDFVFHPGYQLPSLQELENYIANNKHLPGIPTEEEVKKEGIDLGEMNKQLLQKVEELTLYMIQQQKINEQQSKRIEQLEQIVNSKKN